MLDLIFIAVGLGFFHRVEEFSTQVVRKRIELLRPVQGDEGKAAVGLVEDVVVGHGGSWC